MVVYIFGIGVTLFLSFLYDRTKNHKAFLLIFIYLIPFLIMGFRYGIGQDYFYTYVPLYLKIYNGINTGIEKGFELLNRIGILISGRNYQSIFLITSAIFMICIITAAKKTDASMFLMMYIFLCGGFYFYSFNVVRQCLATSIFCTSMYFLRTDKTFLIRIEKINFNLYRLIYLLLIGCAISIHTSAILYLPFLFFGNKEFKKNIYILGILIFAFLVPSIIGIVESALVGQKYYNYISGIWADTSKKINISIILNIIVFLLYFFTERKEDDSLFTIFKNVHYLCVFFTLLIGKISLIFRVTTLFYLIQFLSVPYYYRHYVKKNYKPYFFIIILLIYGALFVNTLAVNGNKILPYAINLTIL